MNEDDLIKKVVSGDADAYGHLIAPYEKPIYNFCLRMLSNAQDAQDLSQEVFIKVYKNISKYKSRDGASFKNWLYRLANNACIDEIRKRKSRVQPESLDVHLDSGENEMERQIDSGLITPEETVIKRERRAAVGKAVGQLPPEFRQMVVLRDLRGLSYEEIAVVTGVKLGTVKSKINRARGKLRELIRDYYV